MKARHFLRDDPGSTAVEFAMIGLVVIMLCLGTLEFGRALHLSNEISFAADRGARLVLLNPQVSDAEVEAEIRANLRMANSVGLQILVREDNNAAQTTRDVTVSLPLTLLIPTLQLQDFRVSVQRKVPTP